MADKIAGAAVIIEKTDDREISKAANGKFQDIHKSTQNTLLTTSEIPSVHHVTFNHDFGKQAEARRQGNHSITRISVGVGEGGGGFRGLQRVIEDGILSIAVTMLQG